jgi:hypothetical protein
VAESRLKSFTTLVKVYLHKFRILFVWQWCCTTQLESILILVVQCCMTKFHVLSKQTLWLCLDGD